MNQRKTCFELRAALHDIGLRQVDMAKICGVKRLQVWRWCDGQAEIPPYVWAILALAKGCPLIDVLRGSVPSWEVDRSHVFTNWKSFRELAKRFHPDATGRDTTAEMQLINKFKGTR